ncbi:MAG: hypothetical protein HY454_02830 [Parcubacteria group bacterium]|nr:hypothetical protein [Parcubacteria group bacterium]
MVTDTNNFKDSKGGTQNGQKEKPKRAWRAWACGYRAGHRADCLSPFFARRFHTEAINQTTPPSITPPINPLACVFPFPVVIRRNRKDRLIQTVTTTTATATAAFRIVSFSNIFSSPPSCLIGFGQNRAKELSTNIQNNAYLVNM